MMEAVNQDRHLYLCTQKEHQSDVEFIKAFQNAVDAINDSGGMAGATMHDLNTVCQERGIDYAALPAKIKQDGTVPRGAGGVRAAQQATRPSQDGVVKTLF